MAQPGGGLEAWSLRVGTAGMALGTLYFLWQGRSVTDPREQKYYVVTTFVPAIAAAAYLSMATGFGVSTGALLVLLYYLLGTLSEQARGARRTSPRCSRNSGV